MIKLRKIVLELVVLALLVTSSVISLGQLRAKAEIFACETLECYAQEDCGPDAKVCFCNRPSGQCYRPEVDQ